MKIDWGFFNKKDIVEELLQRKLTAGEVARIDRQMAAHRSTTVTLVDDRELTGKICRYVDEGQAVQLLIPREELDRQGEGLDDEESENPGEGEEGGKGLDEEEGDKGEGEMAGDEWNIHAHKADSADRALRAQALREVGEGEDEGEGGFLLLPELEGNAAEKEADRLLGLTIDLSTDAKAVAKEKGILAKEAFSFFKRDAMARANAWHTEVTAHLDTVEADRADWAFLTKGGVNDRRMFKSILAAHQNKKNVLVEKLQKARAILSARIAAADAATKKAREEGKVFKGLPKQKGWSTTAAKCLYNDTILCLCNLGVYGKAFLKMNANRVPYSFYTAEIQKGMSITKDKAAWDAETAIHFYPQEQPVCESEVEE